MNKVRIAAAFWCLALGGTALAASPDCASIKAPAKRLKCYDDAQNSDTPALAQKAKQTTAAESALKALRKLRSAAQMGVSLRDYGQLTMEQISSVDEDLISIPGGELKSAIEQSRLAYIDAKDIWSGLISSQYVGVFVSTYKPTYSKYEIDPTYSATLDNLKAARSADINKSLMLAPIWSAAGKSLTQAEQILASAK